MAIEEGIIKNELLWLSEADKKIQSAFQTHYQDTLRELYDRLISAKVDSFQYQHLLILQDQIDKMTGFLKDRLTGVLRGASPILMRAHINRSIETWARLERKYGNPLS